MLSVDLFDCHGGVAQSLSRLWQRSIITSHRQMGFMKLQVQSQAPLGQLETGFSCIGLVKVCVCLCVWFAREKMCTYWFTLCFGIKRINFFYITFSSSFFKGQSISTCKLSVNNYWQAYC